MNKYNNDQKTPSLHSQEQKNEKSTLLKKSHRQGEVSKKEKVYH